jgi:bifunctional DNA-binding transcriptional regulator/antitoxin component of YhaV-PrlF toxin-antitoxin module
MSVDPIIDRGLAGGPINGNFHAMKTTLDRAGRLVIPRDILHESGIKPGMPLEVRWEKGVICITPVPLTVKLERQGPLLVTVPTKAVPPLLKSTVERIRKKLRRERSADST